MKKIAAPSTIPIMDISQVGFLKYHHIDIHQSLSNGKVVFNVPMTPEVMRLLERYAADDLVPVSSFSTCVKTARSQMLSMRPAR